MLALTNVASMPFNTSCHNIFKRAIFLLQSFPAFLSTDTVYKLF